MENAKKEKEVLLKLAKGDANSFNDVFRKKILGYFLKKKQNYQLAEDLLQEVVLKIIRAIRKKPEKIQEIGNPKAWIFEIAENCWNDCLRVKLSKKRKADESGNAEIVSDHKAVAPGSSAYYECPGEDEITHEYFLIDEKTRAGLEKSVMVVEDFYKLIEIIKTNPAYSQFANISEIARDAKDQIIKCLGYNATRKLIIQRTRLDELRGKNPAHLSDSEREELQKLQNDINLAVYRTVIDNYAFIKIIAQAKFIESIRKSFLREEEFYSLIEHALRLYKMRSKPPRLLYAVWARALKKKAGRGKNCDHEKIYIAFRYFERKKEGTLKLESQRKSQYIKSGYSKPFFNAAEFIFRWSFKPDLLPMDSDIIWVGSNSSKKFGSCPSS